MRGTGLVDVGASVRQGNEPANQGRSGNKGPKSRAKRPGLGVDGGDGGLRPVHNFYKARVVRKKSENRPLGNTISTGGSERSTKGAMGFGTTQEWLDGRDNSLEKRESSKEI
jgi:hypothetical protein